jgi:hypothetical protein
MRYFYHIRTEVQQFRQEESNIIKEVSKEWYDRIVLDEQEILERFNGNLEFWHEPFESEDVPEGKRLY